MTDDTDETVQQAYRYAERLSKEFEHSMDPRCFRHQHEGNPCRRCRFIRIEERPAPNKENE